MSSEIRFLQLDSIVREYKSEEARLVSPARHRNAVLVHQLEEKDSAALLSCLTALDSVCTGAVTACRERVGACMASFPAFHRAMLLGEEADSPLPSFDLDSVQRLEAHVKRIEEELLTQCGLRIRPSSVSQQLFSKRRATVAARFTSESRLRADATTTQLNAVLSEFLTWLVNELEQVGIVLSHNGSLRCAMCLCNCLPFLLLYQSNRFRYVRVSRSGRCERCGWVPTLVVRSMR